jgi:hypothetical protein
MAATALVLVLVHEAYLRLVAHERHGWANHAHFYAAAANVTRPILVDHARTRLADAPLSISERLSGPQVPRPSRGGLPRRPQMIALSALAFRPQLTAPFSGR